MNIENIKKIGKVKVEGLLKETSIKANEWSSKFTKDTSKKVHREISFYLYDHIDKEVNAEIKLIR